MRNAIFSKTTGFRKHSRKITGFTLVEVLVSITLFSVAALSAMQSIDHLQGQKTKAEQAQFLSRNLLMWQQEIRAIVATTGQTSGRNDHLFLQQPITMEWSLLRQTPTTRLLRVQLVSEAPLEADHQWYWVLPEPP